LDYLLEPIVASSQKRDCQVGRTRIVWLIMGQSIITTGPYPQYSLRTTPVTYISPYID